MKTGFFLTFKSLHGFSKVFDENNVQPELEVYDVTMLNNVAYLLNNGFLKRPIYVQFVLGILAGIPPREDNVLFLLNKAKELLGDFTWWVCAPGRDQFDMCTLSLLLVGTVRVGLEDNLYLQKGLRAKSNAEQIEKIIGIAREPGLEPDSPDKAREIRKLK